MQHQDGALEPQPRNANADQQLAPGNITDPWEIGAALTILAEDGNMVSLCPAGGGPPLMARVLSVDMPARSFALELRGAAPSLPAPAHCAGTLHNTRLDFAFNIEWRSQAGKPALLVGRFPDACSIQGRRESVRIQTPLGQAYSALFMLNRNPCELQLYDFSLGGFGMRGSRKQAQGLYVGRKLSSALLELGQGVSIVVDFEVRLSRPFRSFLVGEQVQIGCRFISLAAAMELDVRLALADLEQRRKAG